MHTQVINDELELLRTLVDLAQHPKIIELGCGAADFCRRLVAAVPTCDVVGLEVDEAQHSKNQSAPAARMQFVKAGAQQIPFESARFDLAIMLKSLHHVPLDQMQPALAEIHRVLRNDGLLYISEPVFAGALNDVMRLFHDEEQVRAAALEAVRVAVASGEWTQIKEICFDMPVHFKDFAEFERRMIGVTYLAHRLDDHTMRAVRDRFEPHLGPDGANFLRPMRVNLLQRC